MSPSVWVSRILHFFVAYDTVTSTFSLLAFVKLAAIIIFLFDWFIEFRRFILVHLAIPK